MTNLGWELLLTRGHRVDESLPGTVDGCCFGVLHRETAACGTRDRTIITRLCITGYKRLHASSKAMWKYRPLSWSTAELHWDVKQLWVSSRRNDLVVSVRGLLLEGCGFESQ